MAGPWELYQQPEAQPIAQPEVAQPSGPWEQFQPAAQREAVAEATTRRQARAPTGRIPGIVSGFPNLLALETSVADPATMGMYPQIASSVSSGVRNLYNMLTGRQAPATEGYGRERDVIRQELTQERQDLGHLLLPTELVAGVATPLPFASRLYRAAPEGANIVRRALTGTRNLAATGVAGGTLGGIYGYNVTPSWEDAREAAREHALLGALVGPALHAGVSGGIGAYRGVRNVADRARAHAAARAAEFEELGVEAPTAALLPAEGRRVAEWLGGTLMGGGLRRQAVRGQEALHRRLGEELTFGGGPRTASEAGEEVQSLVNRALVVERTPEEIAAMDAARLQDVSGVAPGPNWQPKPPVVRAPPVEPVTPERLVRDVRRRVAPVLPRRPTEQQVGERAQRYVRDRPDLSPAEEPLTAIEAANLRLAESRASRLQQQHEGRIRALNAEIDGFREELEEVARLRQIVGAGGQPELAGGRRPTLRELASRERLLANEIMNRLEEINRSPFTMANVHLARMRAAYERNRADRAAQAVRGREDQSYTNEAAARIRAQRELDIEERMRARRETVRLRDEEAERYRPLAEAEAARATRVEQEAADYLAQREANLAFEQDVARRRGAVDQPFEFPRIPEESYATQLAAARAAVARNAPVTPAARRNPLGRRETQTEPATTTNVVGALERMAAFARSQGQLPGYRGNIFNPTTGQLDEALLLWLQPRLGPEIAGLLRYMSARRAAHQFTPDAKGLSEMQAMFAAAAQRRGVNKTLLGELQRAFERDLEGLTTATGDAGAVYQRQRLRLAELETRYQQEIAEPLATITGETNPAAALTVLQRSVRAGGNINVLRAFLRVAEDKGDRSRAVSTVLQGLAGRNPAEFATNYAALTPEAKQLLFSGPTAVIGQRLERFARAVGNMGDVPTNFRFRDVLRFRNLSMPAGFFVSLPATLTYALGAKGADAVLTSAAFRRWLLRQPIFGRGDAARMQSFAGLAAIPAAAVGLQPESWERARNALIGLANAAMPSMPQLELPEAGVFQDFSGRTDELPEGEFTGTVINPEPEPDGFVSPGLLEAVPQRTQRQSEETNPLMQLLRGVRDAFIPSAEASVIGPVGARALAQAGRPLAQRLISMAERLSARGVDEAEILARAERLITREDPLLGQLTEVAPGQWGIELSNTSARVRLPQPGKPVALGEVLSDPELQAAYPNAFRETRVTYQPNYPGGRHVPEDIVLGQTPSARRTLLHEVEHEGQFIEDFPRGANLAVFEAGGELAHARLPGETANQARQRVSGEFYARAAANRADLPAGIRRSRPLQLPVDALLVRYEGMAEHRPRGWTPERMVEVAQLRREGLSEREIAERFRVSELAVRRAVQRYGREAGIAVPTAEQRQIWQQPEKLQQLAQLWTEGVSRREIAQRLGLTEQQIQSGLQMYRDRLELPRRNIVTPSREVIDRVLEQRGGNSRERNHVALWLGSRGVHMGEIAKRVGVSRQYVEQLFGRAGVDPAYRVGSMVRLAPHAQQLTEMANRFSAESILARLNITDVTPDRLRHWFRRMGVRRETKVNSVLNDPRIEEAIIALVARQLPQRAGSRMMDYIALGRRFGIHPSTVMRQARLLGLPGVRKARRARFERVKVADSVLDRRAMNLEREFVELEDRLRATGLSSEEIAREMNARKGVNVTAEDIDSGAVWWRLGEISDTEFGRGALEFNPRTMGQSYDPLGGLE